MLFLGGLFVLIYFAHIEFLPEIDLTNATALLSSVALIGLFLIFVLCALFVFPGLIIHGLVTSNSISNFTGLKKSAWISSTRRASVTAAFVVAIFHVPLLKHLVDFYLQILISFMIFGYSLYLFQDYQWKDRPETQNGMWHQLCSMSILISIWMVVAVFQTFLFSNAYQGSNDESSWFILVCWLFWVGASNSMWGADQKLVDWKIILLIAALSLYVMVIMASNPTMVSTSAVRTLGLGNVQNVTLLTTKDGCAVLKSAAGPSSCSGTDSHDLFKSQPVTLLSRIGAQYFVSICNDTGLVRISLRKQDVVGWTEPRNAKGDRLKVASCNASEES